MRGYIFSVLFVVLVANNICAQGYKISFKVEGVSDAMCYLGNYFGDKTYIQDSAKANVNGEFTFEGEEPLLGGVYLTVLPGKKYFEVIVDKDQEFFMSTSKSDPIAKMKVKGSYDNEIFYEYLVKAAGLQTAIQKAKHAHESESDKSKKKKLKAELNDAVGALKEYKAKFIEKNSESFVSALFLASEEPEVPEAPTLANGRKDSTFAYRYFKKHFFDNMDISDGRFVRTPIFHKKIERYIKKLTVQLPDSINEAADYLIGLTNDDPESFKYVVWYITNTYEKSKYMGMDAVFVHMVDNYYTEEKATWLNPTQLFKIQDRAKTLKPLLIGKKVKNIVMTDSTGAYKSMYAINTKFTLLYFWDPDCGHCKTVTPKVKEYYDRVKEQGILEIYAVCTEIEIDKWKKYIREYDLNWINVADPKLTNNFRADFDISSTPKIFLLDKDKKIIAKKLSVEQVEDIINLKLKEEL
ncbi:MAG: DUF5106 domain-containing protein [Bacteroidia bacterium]|nr:DUF5106 domain-containing protein [Bacteroidia bacterium]